MHHSPIGVIRFQFLSSINSKNTPKAAVLIFIRPDEPWSGLILSCFLWTLKLCSFISIWTVRGKCSIHDHTAVVLLIVWPLIGWHKAMSLVLFCRGIFNIHNACTYVKRSLLSHCLGCSDQIWIQQIWTNHCHTHLIRILAQLICN